MSRASASAFWAACLWLAAIGSAVAHPLGNFTINHLARIGAHGDRLHIHYVLDIAEIPTFQIMHSADWTAARARAWSVGEAQLVAENLVMEADSKPVSLQLEATSSQTRSGAGGLPILYWTGDYRTDTLPSRAAITVRDRVYADRRIGWKDIVLPGLTDPTNALRSYPSALIGSPRQNDEATFEVADGRIARVRVDGAPQTWNTTSIVRSSALSDLFSRAAPTPLWILFTVLAAFGLGALHGLEPGHGKALLAFTLVGSRATFGQAAILAGALTVAHTLAVLLLGLLLFVAAGFATESLFTWITLLSGLAVTAIGARSLAVTISRRYRHARAHAHGDAHSHADGHQHSHALPGSAPLHFPSAVAAAMSGGIAPCPAAIVVLLTAVHLHRVGYGLALIVVFSLGLATILTGLGLAVVRGAAWLSRRSLFERISRNAPLFTATVISIIGASMLAQGLVGNGLRVAAPALVALTLAGVAIVAVLPIVISSRSTHHPSLAIKETT